MGFLENALGIERGRVAVRGRRSFAEVVAEDQNEVAMEGFFDSIRNLFRRKAIQIEKEFHEEGVSVEANQKVFAVVQAGVKTKREVRPDATPITLAAYAKWLALNGRFINNQLLFPELERVRELLIEIRTDLMPAAVHGMKIVREKIIEPAVKGEEIKDPRTIKTFETPAKLDRLFTSKSERYENIDSVRTDVYLGDWALIKASMDQSVYIRATTIQRPGERIRTGEFECLTPEEVKRLLGVLADIQDEASTILNTAQNPEAARLLQAMEELDQSYENRESVTDAEEKAGQELYREGYAALAQMNEADYAAKYALQNVKVVLRLCDMSVRRMR